MELEKAVKKDQAPDGYSPLVGEDLHRFQEATLGVELFRSHVREEEARVREHQNGLEAAKMAVQQNQLVLKSAINDLVKVKMELGISEKDDLIVKDGKFYRKVNGKASDKDVDEFLAGKKADLKLVPQAPGDKKG